MGDSPLFFALRLDGEGGAEGVDWRDIQEGFIRDEGFWTHLDREHGDARAWLTGPAALAPEIADALLAEETRPRVLEMPQGLMVNLRGVNLNSGGAPDDMISLRIWIEPGRVISLAKHAFKSVQDVRDELDKRLGPADALSLFVRLCARLIGRIGPAIDDLDEWVDNIEEQVLTAPSREIRSQLADLRRQAVSMRRYLSPQRDVLNMLYLERDDFWERQQHWRLLEIHDQMLRYIEDLDETRDRASVTHEELMGRLSDQMNRTMYFLSLVATVFLPLSLLTGLLGVNVGGIPGAHSPEGFAAVCAILVVLGLVETWYFHRKRLF